MKDVTIVVGTIGQSIMRSEDSGQNWARVGPRRVFPVKTAIQVDCELPRARGVGFKVPGSKTLE